MRLISLQPAPSLFEILITARLGRSAQALSNGGPQVSARASQCWREPGSSLRSLRTSSLTSYTVNGGKLASSSRANSALRHRPLPRGLSSFHAV